MASKIKAARTAVTGRIKATTTPADYGEISVNIADRKLFIRDAAGVSRLIVQGIADYSAALIYALGDLTIESNRLYICTTAVPVPEPFDLANWTLLGGGGTTDGSVILAPATAGRNRIVPAAAAAEGILIDAPSTQTADLLAIEGTALSDTGRWAVDAQGFSNQRVGAVVWRQAEPTHNFVARGQPAAFNGTRWVPADADEPWGVALAIVQEIIDANTLVLRSGGRITNLQTAAFAGGTITPGTAYYASATVPGQLTPVEPTTGRRDPVLTAISATAGVVTTGASRNLVEAPPPTHVGPTAPLNPELGDLWYRTVAPVGLLVFRDDVSIGEWVPATLPEVSVGDLPPTAPQPGNLWFKTVNPVGLYIWYTDVDSSQWVAVGGNGGGGGGGSPTEVEIVKGAAGWQVVGDQLICWGNIITAGNPTVLTFPRGFKTTPRIVATVGNTTDCNATAFPISTTQAEVRSFVQTGAFTTGLSVDWIAIGEALDADKMPKEVQIPGGGGGGDSGGLPVGTVAFFAANSVPAGWLVCNNQRVTTIYPDLRQYLLDAGSPFGEVGGDPRVPELRGEFIRGFSSGRAGVDDGRVFGSSQGADIAAHRHDMTQVFNAGSGASSGMVASAVAQPTNNPADAFKTLPAGGTETRPRNVALLACIRAFAATVVEGQANFGIATNADVRAGTRNDAALTPANVRALSGVQVFALTGLSTMTFDQIPLEASEIDFSFATAQVANAVVRLDFENAPAARFTVLRQALAAAYAAPIAEANSVICTLDNHTSAAGIAGLIRLVRDVNGGFWRLQGNYRRGSNTMITLAGNADLLGEVGALFRFSTTVSPFTAGDCAMRWRI